MTNDLKWVPGKWEDVKPGDLIKLEHQGGSVLFAAATIDPNGSFTTPLTVEVANRMVDLTAFVGHGWALSVEKKPTPTLPTEPGVYLDKDGDLWTLHKELGLRYERDNTWDTEDGWALYAPFTRLEPVADTAKKVLDRVFEILPGPFPNAVAVLAEEFGVTS